METVRNLLVDPVQITQGKWSSSGGDDVIDMFSRKSSTKGITSMILPNGHAVASIPADKIIMQTVNLSSSTVDYEIECMNRDIYDRWEIDQGKKVDVSKSREIIIESDIKNAKTRFPNGGPSQGTWFHMRDGLAKGDEDAIHRVVEVGIITL